MNSTLGSNALIDALAAAIGERMGKDYQKAGSASGTPGLPYIHGPGGLFGVSGLEREVFSTHVQARGLLSHLPVRGSNFTNPLYPYITGFQASTGSNPNAVCDDPMTAGAMKSCIQTAQFGRYTYQTREAEVNRVGQLTNRGEFDDLFIVNNPVLGGLAGSGNPFVPMAGQNGMELSARNEVFARMLELGVAFERKLADQVWNGNPSNNSAGGGYKEFPGLNILIGTNKVDALTNTTCPSLRSDVRSFNYQLVSATTPSSIVDLLSYIYRDLRIMADRMAFSPVEWAIVMRPELFWEVTAAWPCSYLSYRCAPGTSATEFIDSADAIGMRDEMRNGRYLLVDGVRVPVILDDGITEESNSTTSSLSNGRFASDIYFVPMTVAGGRAVTFLEYLNYQDGAMQAVQDARMGSFFWTDGGRFLFHAKTPINWCIQMIAKIEPRVILLTPHLAARLQHVGYAPTSHARQPFPTDPYFVDGGVSTARSAPSLWSDWKLS